MQPPVAYSGEKCELRKILHLETRNTFFYLQMPRSPASSLVNALLITASDSNASLNSKRKFATLIAESISFQFLCDNIQNQYTGYGLFVCGVLVSRMLHRYYFGLGKNIYRKKTIISKTKSFKEKMV